MAEEKIPPSHVAEITIESLILPSRTKNALISAGFLTIGSISGLFLEDIKGIPGIGGKGLLELKELLNIKYKISFKRKPKVKTTADFSGAQEVVTHLVGDKITDWPRQIKIADVLIKKYTKDILLRVKPIEKVYSLGWYLNPKYGAEYIRKFVPIQLVEDDPVLVRVPEITDEELVEFVSQKNEKPKSLKEFLNV